jgi:hypothetical protein
MPPTILEWFGRAKGYLSSVRRVIGYWSRLMTLARRLDGMVSADREGGEIQAAAKVGPKRDERHLPLGT